MLLFSSRRVSIPNVLFFLIVLFNKCCPSAAFSLGPHAVYSRHVSTRKVTRTVRLFTTHINSDEEKIPEEGKENENLTFEKHLSRRSMICSTAFCAMLGSGVINPAYAAESITASNIDQSSTTKSFPPVTHRVYLDLRVSRSDGSFYVRDDLPDIPENRVFNGRLVLGLFGTAAPNHVDQFLKYVNVTYNPTEDDPLPSYSRSNFLSLDQQSGLLVGGKIPGLDTSLIGGSTVLKYGGRILPAPFWSEKKGNSGDGSISHNAGKGLLTHRNLDVTPSFGITTRPAGFELDGTHTVFGRVLSDEGSFVGGGVASGGSEDKKVSFLRIVEDIPTYSMDRPAPPADVQPSEGERAVQEIASAVFSTQRDFFRGAAKTFGDTRLDKVYEGKLLRRVEVTKAGLL